MNKLFQRRAALLALVAFAVSACGRAPTTPMIPLAPLALLAPTGAGRITHIVYIVQENRSFDNLFQGYPGADTVSRGKNSSDQTIRLQPVGLARQYVIDHSFAAMAAACNSRGSMPGTRCRMNGFNREQSCCGPPNPEYVYVPHSDSKPYFDMAHEWTLADHMFQSQLDESFVGHQYIIAAQADHSVDLPNPGQWGCGGQRGDVVDTLTPQRTIGPAQPPCFDYQTLGDELDRAGLTWRFYTSQYNTPASGEGAYWSSYQAVRHIFRHHDWYQNVLCCVPQTKFITDVAAGKLANFTWITPICANSDHVNCGGGFGPSWVATLVNAVGKSKYWDHTVIFVQWDDWGGLYDHVKPPYLGFDSLGFRVPLLVISPYAKHDYVSHVQYETASVLRFAEDLFGLGQLADADARATSPAVDCFDFSRRPQPFVPIKSPKGPWFFMHQHPDLRIPDDE